MAEGTADRRLQTTDRGAGTANRGKRSGKRFWREKLAANVRRDRWVTRQLRRHGWRVVRIWEHELAKNPPRCVGRIKAALAARPGGGKAHGAQADAAGSWRRSGHR